jgi:hypothetical protein
MAKKMKRFDEGGYTGDDPIVKYRMGMIDAKGNDLTKSKKETYENNAPYKSDDQGLSKPYVKPAVQPEIKFETKQGDHPKINADTREQALFENAPRYIRKGSNPKSITPDRLVRKDILDQFPGGSGRVMYPTDYDNAGYKKGGTVKSVKTKSASARADGCAIRGKTKA